MKQLCIGLLLAGVASAVFGQAEVRIQLIHNSSDPVLEKVDIYVNHNKVANNLHFRQATDFITLPLEDLYADGSDYLTLSVAPATANSVSAAYYSLPFKPVEDQDYVAMVMGLLNPADFASNPQGHNTELDILMMRGRTQAPTPNKIALAFVNGVTDSRSCGVFADGVEPIASVTPYHAALRYSPLSAHTEFFEVLEGGSTVSNWEADFAAHAGEAGVLFYSGFSSCAGNKRRVKAGMYTAFPDGTVTRLSDEDPAWTTGCTSDVEVIGVGPGCSDSVTMVIGDPTDIDSIVVEIVSKADTAATLAHFWSNVEGPYVRTGTLIPPIALGTDEVRVFRQTMVPADSISIWTDAHGPTKSVVAYVFRSGGTGGYASKGFYAEHYLFKGTYDLNVAIDVASGPRDVKITVPLSDLDDNVKKAVITATAGSVTQTVEYNDSDLGALLRIAEFTLTDVPGDVTEVQLHFDSPIPSPVSAGDSYIFGVIVSAECVSDCEPPGDLLFTQLGPQHGTATWGAIPGAIGYQICGVLDGDSSTLVSHLRNTNNKTFFNLDPGVVYTFNVRVMCADSTLSEFSEIYSFTLAPPRLEESQEIDFKLYPNPASERMLIDFEAAKSDQLTVTLSDATGTILLASTQSLLQGSHQIEVDVANMPAGLYIVTLRDSGQSYRKRLLIAR